MTESLVLVGIITRIVVLDTSDLASPQVLWQSDAFHSVQGIELIGDRAYVRDDGNLLVWDISDPAQPLELGRLPIENWGWGYIIPDSREVHVITGFPDKAAQVHRVDVSDPSTPTELGRVRLEAFPYNLALIDGYGYALYDGYVQVLDLSQQPTATAVLTMSLPTNINSQIQVVGHHAYVTTPEDMWVLDISDPAVPYLAGSYQEVTVESLYVDGLRTYLVWQLCGWELDENDEPTGGCGQGVDLISLSDVARPCLRGVYRFRMEEATFIEVTCQVGSVVYLLTDTQVYAVDLSTAGP